MNDGFSRLWVALPSDVDAEELLEKLGRGVPGVSTVAMKNMDGSSRGFGFITLPSDVHSAAIAAAYNGTKWKGVRIQCALARPDYLERLRREKEARADEEAERTRKKRSAAAAFFENLQLQAQGESNPILRIRKNIKEVYGQA